MTAPNPDHSERFYGYAGHSDQTPAAPAPPAYAAPRRRRHTRRWIIVAVVLVGLLVGADRVAAAVAESTLASKIQSSQKLSQKPSVSIDGFPFLTQVIARHFGHATIDIRGLVASGVPISDIHADVTGVHVSSGYNSAMVDTLVATAMLNYSDLSSAVTNLAGIGQVQVSQGTGGQLKATYSLVGIDVSAQVAVSLLAGNTIELKSGAIDTGLLGSLTTPAGFDVKIPLGNLPFGMQLKDLAVTSTAVDISATGHNVSLSGNTMNQ